MQHLKRILRTSVIHICNEIGSFHHQKFEKNDFSEIRLKNLVGFLQTRPNFWTAIQDMLKITLLPLSQHTLGKSQEF